MNRGCERRGRRESSGRSAVALVEHLAELVDQLCGLVGVDLAPEDAHLVADEEAHRDDEELEFPGRHPELPLAVDAVGVENLLEVVDDGVESGGRVAILTLAAVVDLLDGELMQRGDQVRVAHLGHDSSSDRLGQNGVRMCIIHTYCNIVNKL